MKKIKATPFYFLSLAAIMVLMSACNNKDCSAEGNYVNPNGDSELALLMREMFDDGKRIRQSVLEGDRPVLVKKFKEIHTAEATEPEKAASEAYKMYADAYLNALEMLESSDEENLASSYGAMIQSCVNCHQQMCPGPLVRINKLKLPDGKL